MEFKIEIIQSHTFTEEDFDYLLTTAVEGGINYWCKKVEILGEQPSKKNQFLDITVALINDQKIRFYDAESDDTWDLDMNSFINGIKEYCLIRNVSLNELMDNHDADSADEIIQLALFDDIVFS